MAQTTRDLCVQWAGSNSGSPLAKRLVKRIRRRARNGDAEAAYLIKMAEKRAKNPNARPLSPQAARDLVARWLDMR